MDEIEEARVRNEAMSSPKCIHLWLPAYLCAVAHAGKQESQACRVHGYKRTRMMMASG